MHHSKSVAVCFCADDGFRGTVRLTFFIHSSQNHDLFFGKAGQEKKTAEQTGRERERERKTRTHIIHFSSYITKSTERINMIADYVDWCAAPTIKPLIAVPRILRVSTHTHTCCSASLTFKLSHLCRCCATRSLARSTRIGRIFYIWQLVCSL